MGSTRVCARLGLDPATVRTARRLAREVTAPVIDIVETTVPVITQPVTDVVQTIPNVICVLLCGR